MFSKLMAYKIVSLDAIRLIEEEMGLKFTIYLNTEDAELATILMSEIIGPAGFDTRKEEEYLSSLKECYLNKDLYKPSPETEEQVPSDEYHVRLSLDLHYKLGKTPKSDIDFILMSCGNYLSNRGLLTGETDAEIVSMGSAVSDIPPI